MDSLYHYTKFDVLDSMLKNNEIWLGNLQYMNDRKEISYFFERLENSVVVACPGKEQDIRDLFSKQKERLQNQNGYVFSLSKNSDDAAQWARYANNGYGVCIKFNGGIISNLVKKNGYLQEIFYVGNVDNHQMTAIIVVYILEHGLSNGFNSIDGVFDNAWACSMSYKHPSFISENEKRIITSPIWCREYEMKYDASINSLREFMAIKLDMSEAIEEIIIGPKSEVEIEMLKRYMTSINEKLSKVKVSVSECPLR